jgi:hypothetical protein
MWWFRINEFRRHAMSRLVVSEFVDCRTAVMGHVVADYLRSVSPEARTQLTQTAHKRATQGHFCMDHFCIHHVCPSFVRLRTAEFRTADCHTAGFRIADFRTAGCCNLAGRDLVKLLDTPSGCPREVQHVPAGCTRFH